MIRPKRITLLSLLLGWLAIGGFGNSYIMLYQDTFSNPLMGIISGVYGVLALASSIGLWRLALWSAKLFLSWSALLLIMAFIMQFTFIEIPIVNFMVFVSVLTIILFGINRYVKRIIEQPTLKNTCK
jgi:uncharacterized membrane protein (DUF2068 family)